MTKNYTIDKNTGAVLFHKSPELQEILKLNQKLGVLEDKIDKLEHTVDTLANLLKEVKLHE